MQGRGSSTHCVCVYVSVTTMMGATSPIKAKLRYQDKVLNVGDKINVGIENVMTVIMIAIG